MTDPDEGQTIVFDPQLVRRTLQRYVPLIVFYVLFGGILGAGYQHTRPKAYKATALLVVGASPTAQALSSQSGLSASTGLSQATEVSLLRSAETRLAVQNKIGTFSNVAFGAVADSAIITVTASSPKPARAAQVANAYVSIYLSAVTQRVTKGLVVLRDETTETLSLDSNALSRDEQALGRKSGAQAGPPTQLTGGITRLEALVTQSSTFLQELNVAIAEPSLGIYAGPAAEVPGSASGYSDRRAAELGGVVGLVLALGIIAGIYAWPGRIMDAEEAGSLVSLPVISAVPVLSKRRRSPPIRRKHQFAVTQEEAWDIAAVLVTRRDHHESGRLMIGISGCDPDVDAGSAALHLARSLARMRKDVFLIDALAAPTQAAELEREVEAVQSCAYRTDAVRTRYFGANECGQMPGSQEIDLGKVGSLLSSGDVVGDIVIIACPPAQLSGVTVLLSAYADRCFVAFTPGTTMTRSLRGCIGFLRRANSNIEGLIAVGEPRRRRWTFA